MKSYVTDRQLRLVGKGWEVRQKLRSMSDEADGGQAELAALLPMLIHAIERAKPQPEPQRTRTNKTTDRRVIPFPSS